MIAKFESRTSTTRDGHHLLIREADPSDAGAILRHVEHISGESEYLTMGPGDFDWTLVQEETYLAQLQLSDNQLYIIALVEGQLAGALSFSAGTRPRIRHSGELAMSVRSSYWGQGIGSKLLDSLIAWSRSGKIITKINLRVRTDNERAIHLYESKGFVCEGLIRKAIYLDGIYHDLYWMGLEL